MQPKVLIWDLGGVLVKFQHLFENEEFLRKCGVSREAVASFFNNEDFFRYERGQVSSEDFFAAAKEKLKYGGNYDEFRFDYCSMLKCEPNRPVLDIVYRLKVRYGDKIEFWLLSNLGELHYDHIHGRWPGIFANFFQVFLSFRLNCRKPEPEIYKKAARLGGVTPSVCLFIDDVEANCRGAAEALMNFVCFKSVPQLESSLVGYEIKL